MKRILFVMMLGFFLCGVSLAQVIQPVGNLQLGLDFARFRNNNQSGYLEIYYSLLPNRLTFKKIDGKFYAGTNIRTRIMNEATKEVINEKTMPVQIAETDTADAWYRFPFVTQAGFTLPFGKYNFEVVAIDSLQPARKDSIAGPVEVIEYPSNLQISDIQLCKNIVNSKKKNDLFYKNSLEVVPLPSLVFGVATCPVLFHYAELYNITPNKTYLVKTQVVNEYNEVVRETQKEQIYKNTLSLLVGSTTVTSFTPGRYTFRCEISDSEENVLVTSDKGFVIINPHLSAPTTASELRIARETEGLTLEELKQEFHQAKYVATEDEIKIFDQISSDSGLRKFLIDFWITVEKGRLDRPEISRSVYLQRVKIANEQFTSFGKDGWRSDRGRIFILYGNPDEIERFPAQADSKAHQIWAYFSIESGVEFVFVDRVGYSDYQLVHSTKRGELSDETWAAKYLQ